jgi:hypothetical protein
MKKDLLFARIQKKSASRVVGSRLVLLLGWRLFNFIDVAHTILILGGAFTLKFICWSLSK